MQFILMELTLLLINAHDSEPSWFAKTLKARIWEIICYYVFHDFKASQQK